MFTNMYLDNVNFRFGIGRFTTEAEIDYTAEKCIEHVSRLREMRYVIYRLLSAIQDALFCQIRCMCTCIYAKCSCTWKFT